VGCRREGFSDPGDASLVVTLASSFLHVGFCEWSGMQAHWVSDPGNSPLVLTSALGFYVCLGCRGREVYRRERFLRRWGRSIACWIWRQGFQPLMPALQIADVSLSRRRLIAAVGDSQTSFLGRGGKGGGGTRNILTVTPEKGVEEFCSQRAPVHHWRQTGSWFCAVADF
jgi:hypothetical protein